MKGNSAWQLYLHGYTYMLIYTTHSIVSSPPHHDDIKLYTHGVVIAFSLSYKKIYPMIFLTSTKSIALDLYVKKERKNLNYSLPFYITQRRMHTSMYMNKYNSLYVSVSILSGCVGG